MRTGTRLPLCQGFAGKPARWITASLLATALFACADDDPDAIDPAPPIAESRLGAPEEIASPRVVLLLDTSGSMQWRGDCTCSSPSCAECLPSCEAQQRSRWHLVLEALTGSFESFGCRHQLRTASEGATYDLDYPIPNIALAPFVEQRSDGLLARYEERVGFGVATFDSVPAYGSTELVAENAFDYARSRDVEGMSSYAGSDPRRATRARSRPDGSTVGRVYYPKSAGPFLIDTGIRSQQAPEGALVLPGEGESARERTLRITDQLLDVRPFGGSPTAAALDDLYFALDHAARPTTPKTYVVLITDGLPDDDFRRFPQPGCGCSSFEECGEDPSAMSCPYPLPSEAAQHLRCGFEPDGCDGPADTLFVVALLSQDEEAVQQGLDAIAAAGGSGRARFASSLTELTAVLDAIVDPIASDSGAQPLH